MKQRQADLSFRAPTSEEIHTMKYLIACVALLSSAVFAQSSVPTSFPEGATAATEDQLKSRLTGQVHSARMTNGDDWRFQWMSTGYLFLNTSRGYADKGQWRVEEGKVCVDMNKSGPACSEMRIVDDVLYMKRASNGEVVAMQPK